MLGLRYLPSWHEMQVFSSDMHIIPLIALQDVVLHAQSSVFKTDPSVFEQVFPELHVLVEEVQ